MVVYMFAVVIDLCYRVLSMLRPLRAFIILHCTVSMLYSLQFRFIQYILPCGVKGYGENLL
jgi:hypothetical protein